MKKAHNILIAISGALLLTSCLSSTVGDGQDVINIKPVIGTGVRSASEDIDVPVGVYAFTQDGHIYIDREKLELDSGKWSMSKEYLWPSDGMLRFFAFSPFDAGFEIVSGDAVLEDYTPTSSNSELLVTDDSEFIEATPGEVCLELYPATSQLDFRVANGLNKETSVRLEKMVLKGISLSGNLSTENGLRWTLTGAKRDLVLYDASEDSGMDEVTFEPRYFGKLWNVLPQSSLPVIELTYSFSTSGSGWLRGQIQHTGKLTSDWLPGRKYTYTLVITENLVRHTVGITDREGNTLEK